MRLAISFKCLALRSTLPQMFIVDGLARDFAPSQFNYPVGALLGNCLSLVRLMQTFEDSNVSFE
jgi:hypothetical protein